MTPAKVYKSQAPEHLNGKSRPVINYPDIKIDIKNDSDNQWLTSSLQNSKIQLNNYQSNKFNQISGEPWKMLPFFNITLKVMIRYVSSDCKIVFLAKNNIQLLLIFYEKRFIWSLMLRITSILVLWDLFFTSNLLKQIMRFIIWIAVGLNDLIVI